MGRPFSLELKMRVVALKDLTYSPDGLRIEAALKDQEFDCPDGIVADYVAVGLIGPPGPPRSAADQRNPEDTPKNSQEPTPDQSEALAAKNAEAAAAEVAERDAARMADANADPDIEEFEVKPGDLIRVEQEPTPDPVAAAKAAEADAAPRHAKAPRKPKAG